MFLAMKPPGIGVDGQPLYNLAMRSAAILGLLWLTSLWLTCSPATAQELPLVNGFAARINGKVITLAELDMAVNRQLSARRDQIPPEDMQVAKNQLRPLMLKSLIERELLLGRALQDEIRLPAGAVDQYLQKTVDNLSRVEGTRYSVDDYLSIWERQFGEGEADLRKRLSEELKIDALRHENIRVTRTISPKALREYYLSNQEEFTGESHLLFRQILIASDDPDSNKMMTEINRSIDSDASFEELVKEWSMGPRKDIGGLYSVTEEELDQRFPPVPEVVRELKPNEISDWFMCRGYNHKILLVEKKPGIPLEFSRAQGQIRMILINKLESKRKIEFERELWEEATIEVFIPGVQLPKKFEQ